MKDLTTRKNFVFLDLEETCIDDWSTATPLVQNLEKIDWFINGKEVIIPPFKKNQEPIVSPPAPMVNLHLGIMSWAVWDDVDKQLFLNLMREPIEKAIKRKFDDSLILSMADWADLVFECSGMRLSRHDMFDIYGKPDVLFMLMRKHPMFINSTTFLVDDAYEHQLTLTSHVRGAVVEFHNINDM
jgi:hypothetical protein